MLLRSPIALEESRFLGIKKIRMKQKKEFKIKGKSFRGGLRK
jgi:hypothetical protein